MHDCAGLDQARLQDTDARVLMGDRLKDLAVLAGKDGRRSPLTAVHGRARIGRAAWQGWECTAQAR